MSGWRLVLVAWLAAAGATLVGGEARADWCREALGRSQPVLGAAEPARAFVEGVWERLYQPFLRATGRETALVLLGPKAGPAKGGAFPRLAMACQRPDGPPAVVVTWPFLATVWGPDGVDQELLAMVLAHELGHRQHDFDARGRFLGRADEVRADRRGAFIAASAGFDARRIICGGKLDAFLVEESVADAARLARREALPSVVSRFEFWEAVHMGLSALVSLDPEAVVATLAALKAELDREREVLPELGLLHATALAEAAAPSACWQERLAVEGFNNQSVRCAWLFTSQTSWGARREDGPLRGCDERARRLLAQADKVLAELERTSVSAAGLAVARGCVALYDGELEAARGWFARAEDVGGAMAGLGPVLTANRALIGWLEWLEPVERRAPSPFAGKAASGWRKVVKGQRALVEGHPALAAWLDGVIAGKPRGAPRRGLEGICEGGDDGGRRSWTSAPPPAGANGCPCGWSEEHAMWDPGAPTTTPGLVRLCAPGFGGGSTAERWLEVQLPGRGVEARLHLLRPPDGTNLALWSEGCDALDFIGADERGGTLWRAECPTIGAREAVVRAVPGAGGRGCVIDRVVRRVGVP